MNKLEVIWKSIWWMFNNSFKVQEKTANPIVILLPDGRKIETCENLRLKCRGATFEIPKGFTCDGASIPKALWWLCGSPFTGKYRVAALFHDAAYAGSLEMVDVPHLKLTRLDADLLFLAVMRAYGCNPVRACVKYLAVRLFGGGHFNNGG